jgi:hypothetical protein
METTTSRIQSRLFGQGTVEFALTSIAFLFMLLLIIEGGRLLYTYHELTSTAREGARYAAAQGYHSGNVTDSDSIADYVATRVAGLDSDSLTVVADWPGDAGCGTDPEEPELNRPGCPVTIDVTYSYQPLITAIAGSGTITLQADSAMRVHY